MPVSCGAIRAMRRDCDGKSTDAAPRAAPNEGNRRMDRKHLTKLALGFFVFGAALLLMPATVFAQEAAEKGTFLTSNGAAWLGGAIGAGLAIMCPGASAMNRHRPGRRPRTVNLPFASVVAVNV